MNPLLAIGAIAWVLAGMPARAAAERPSGAPDDWPDAMHEPWLYGFLLADQLEYAVGDGEDRFRWEVEGWLGGDYDRLWLETEGEVDTTGPSSGDAEIQALYGRALTPFWDMRIGVRQDFLFGSGPDRERTLAVVDLKGLAPLWFEVTPALYVSDDGDVSARITATYDLLLTQRLIAQPRFELNAAAHDARDFGIRRGLSDVELGLRVRYEIRRELAPYVGAHWVRKLGNTADLARDDGEDVSVPAFVAGVRLWF